MRSSRIARQTARIIGAAAVSALLLGGVTAAPAHAAHGVVAKKASVATAGAQPVKAHGV